jgi:hypothetical protein
MPITILENNGNKYECYQETIKSIKVTAISYKLQPFSIIRINFRNGEVRSFLDAKSIRGIKRCQHS